MYPDLFVRAWALVVVFMLGACAAPRPRSAPSRTSVLWFGGDVHFGLRSGAALEGLELDGPLVVNLEGPLSVSAEASTAQRLLNPIDAPARLRKAGVIAAGVDNNHAGDLGPAGETARALDAAGISPLGTRVLDLDGQRVTLMQVDLSSGVPAGLSERIRAARPPVIVLFHVLAPPLYLPEPPLLEAVDIAVDAGAAAVLAHGSHSIANVERRGATVIAWGLGNLAFDCDCTSEREGLLVRLELAGERVSRATAVPVIAGLHGERAHTPHDASGALDTLEALGAVFPARTAQSADW